MQDHYKNIIKTILSQERGMVITEINVTLRNEEKLKAFVNVTFDNQFVVRGMKVIKGANGFFVSMPSRRMPDGSFRDIAHPINNDFREFIEKAILEEYTRKFESGDTEANSDLVEDDIY
jgi:stage V sporulation protein G